MLGWLYWTEKRERAGETTLAGLPVFRAGVLRREGTPEWLLRRRIRAAGRKLARAGVRRLLWPEGFPYGELLAGEGILPVDTLPLWQGLAAELAWRELRRRGIPPGEGRAAVCAGRLTAEARRTVEALLRRCPRVALDAPDPGGGFSRALRRSSGAALLTGNAGADVRILFAQREPSRPGDIPLYPGAAAPEAALRLPEGWEKRLPEGVCRSQAAAALWAAGRLPLEQIALADA